MKKFIYFIGLFIFVFSFFYSLFCTAQNLNEIRNLRSGKHQNFYRVVLETSMKVDTKIELKTLPYRAIIKIPESLWRASNIPRKGNFYPNIPIIYSFKKYHYMSDAWGVLALYPLSLIFVWILEIFPWSFSMEAKK